MNATVMAPSPMPTTPLLTAEEFLKLHGDEANVELVKGRVVRYPMPGPKHGEVCFNVALIVGGFIKKNGLGRVMTNDTFVRTGEEPETFRGADLSFLSYARLSKDQPLPKGSIVSPDLVVEVRSPTDRLNRLTGKASEYLEAGVSVVLVLIPETQTAAIYRNDELPVRFGSDEELTLPEVLPGFAIPVRAFFE